MAAALATGMAIATPTAAFATGEGQDVSVASENASDSYYYIGDSSYGLSTYLSEAVAQGSTKIHVGTSFTDKGTVPFLRLSLNFRDIPKAFSALVRKRLISAIPIK